MVIEGANVNLNDDDSLMFIMDLADRAYPVMSWLTQTRPENAALY